MSERGKRDPLHEELDQHVADLWKATQFGGHRRGIRPAVDSYRCDDPERLVVVVDLPGVDPKTVQIILQDRTLVIAGERSRPQVCGRRYQQMEIAYGPFQRRVHLHEHIDAGSASASYENGLFTIVLPVAKSATGPVRVPIQLGPKP